MRFFMEKASRGAIGINERTLHTGLTKSSQDWSPVGWIGARPLVGCKRGERDQYEQSAEWNSTTRAGWLGLGNLHLRHFQSVRLLELLEGRLLPIAESSSIQLPI